MKSNASCGRDQRDEEPRLVVRARVRLSCKLHFSPDPRDFENYIFRSYEKMVRTYQCYWKKDSLET